MAVTTDAETGDTRTLVTNTRTLVTDTGAVPFVDLSIGSFGDIVSGARSLSASGSWVVRTPMGLLVHSYEHARGILRDQDWISVLAGASVLAQRAEQATSGETEPGQATQASAGTDLSVIFERAAVQNQTTSDAPASNSPTSDAPADNSPTGGSSARAQLAPRPNVLSVEGADHHRLRRLVSAAFTPASTERLRPFMAAHARRLLDEIFTNGQVGNGQVTNEHSTNGHATNRHSTSELVDDLCRPYPIPIICELLGAPAEDWQLFDRWAETILGVFDADTDALLSRVQDITTARQELDNYVADLVAKRRANPGDDLLSQLIAAQDEDNDQLSSDELAAMVEALLLAGTDTTRNQLGATLAAFADHPEQYQLLRQNPDLVPAAVEESLRYLGAVRSTARLATKDIEIDGIVFPAGTTVVVGLHAASLSADADDINPDDINTDTSSGSYQFDITAKRNRPHLAFGSGIHHCLGAFLARAELQEALTQFVEKVETFELTETVVWKPLSLGIWGPARMAVRLNTPSQLEAPAVPDAPASSTTALNSATTNGTPNATPDTTTNEGHKFSAGTIAAKSSTSNLDELHDKYLSRTVPLRKKIQAAMPALVRPPRIPPIGRLAVTAILIGWAVFAMRGWDWLLRRNKRADEHSADQPSADKHSADKQRARTYRRLRKAAERLGPSYVKLAQLIAAGEGVFPEALVNECRACRDQVTAMPWHKARQVIETDLGPLHKRFAKIDPTPLAAASIAQAHPATLLDGTEVVIKVQRPGITRKVKKDIAVLAWVAPRLVGRIPIAALANPPALVELFAETISEELDFRVEVANMIEVERALRTQSLRTQSLQGTKSAWQLPTPHLDAVTKRIIVMSRVPGRPLSSLKQDDLPAEQVSAIFGQMTNSLLEGTCVHGIFHGDFHAGNVLVDEHGNIGLVDFGITGRLEGSRRIAFLRYVVGLLTGDVVAQLDGMGQLGAFSPGVDGTKLAAELGLDRNDFDPLRLSEEEFVAEFRALISGLLKHGARIPKELMLFIKNFAYITSVMGELHPDMDILAQFERTASSFVARNGVRMAGEIGFSVTPDHVTETALRQAMGVSSQEKKVTWRLLRNRRSELTERISSSPSS